MEPSPGPRPAQSPSNASRVYRILYDCQTRVNMIVHVIQIAWIGPREQARFFVPYFTTWYIDINSGMIGTGCLLGAITLIHPLEPH